MGSEDNRLRRKWQDYSGKNAGQAEDDFYQAFKTFFEDTEYQIRAKPKEFSELPRAHARGINKAKLRLPSVLRTLTVVR